MTRLIKTVAAVALVAAAMGASAADAQLYMAGDSIMAEYKSDMFPQYGWGQALKSFMKDPASLHNFARSGWSARRFRESGRWEKNIASQLKPGDWVIVSFGHNDMNKKRNKPPKNDYSTIDEYKAFLKGFAADAKSKGANIAFATSIAHSDGFSEKDGVMTVDGGAAGLGPYVDAMRELAAELKVPLLDLNRYAEENLPKMGLEKAKALYMIVRPGEYANYPDGKNDSAHIRDEGAFFMRRARSRWRARRILCSRTCSRIRRAFHSSCPSCPRRLRAAEISTRSRRTRIRTPSITFAAKSILL